MQARQRNLLFATSPHHLLFVDAHFSMIQFTLEEADCRVETRNSKEVLRLNHRKMSLLN